MKILAIKCNPRPAGICDSIAERFFYGSQQAGAEVEVVDFSHADVRDCLGCFQCATNEGVCIQKDEMKNILEKLSTSDALLFVSPVYFHTMSTSAKRFFDRCFPIFNKKIDTSLPKKFVAISAAGGRGRTTFQALQNTYEEICKSLNFEFCAHLWRGESIYFGELGMGSVRVKKILNAFEDAGREFAKTGNIQNSTLEVATQDVSPSEEEFAKRQKTFWQLVRNRKLIP